MDTFLQTYNLPKLNQGESENLIRQITPTEIEAVVKQNKTKQKKPPNKQKSRTGWLHRGILPNIPRRTNISPSQTIS